MSPGFGIHTAPFKHAGHTVKPHSPS